MNHVHHDLIVAWAKGAKTQFYGTASEKWLDVPASPSWDPQTAYRIKPEPKPDLVLYGMIQLKGGYAKIDAVGANVQQRDTDTCMFIFDGETGALKDAQVLAKLAV